MAAPGVIDGVTEETPFAEAAALVIEARVAELVIHSERVLDVEDISHLHDMRVATRRLRAALEVFAPCLPRRRHKRLLADVKGLADALGERRDRDVAIRSLTGFAESLPRPDRPGVGSLIESYREQQTRANDELAPAVDPRWLQDLERRARELAAAARELAGTEDGRWSGEG
jgi:CHAD domain-containing protein